MLRGSNPSTVIVDSEVGDTLARDMIEVHGTEAATIARDNTRVAALAAQIPEAKAWIRVLGIIQRIRPDQGLDPQWPGTPPRRYRAENNRKIAAMMTRVKPSRPRSLNRRAMIAKRSKSRRKIPSRARHRSFQSA